MLNLPKLTRIDGDTRVYETPSGNKYPSVTTILGEVLDNHGLESWKLAVGKEEAKKIAGLAARRGSAIHDLLEKYVLQSTNYQEAWKKACPSDKWTTKKFLPVLENVSDVLGCETQLYSDKMKAAGTADLIASYKRIPSIIDYKTASSMKHLDMIEGYILQTTIYSYMLYERTGKFHNQLVIIIGCEDSNVAQVFIEKASDHIDRAIEICKIYHERKKNE